MTNRHWSKMSIRLSSALALALVSITVACLCVALSTFPALEGQDLEVASCVIFHVTELIYALAADTTYQILHWAPCPYILCDHLIEALVYSLVKICRGIVKDGSDGNGGRSSSFVFRPFGDCLEEPIVWDFVVVAAAVLIIVIIR